ncbi:hypothetical protein D7294_17230 [Streptomyces hoynatensis]|uniref:Transposase IS4-like domain-containing protein n=1 Tax=Streptomyces hoynatensis TaxID=1141874 RepID=A0A3A9YY24_9ACTN|nr:hypothetical protein D7294_17230 [Streptomyces hoynatensis]
MHGCLPAGVWPGGPANTTRRRGTFSARDKTGLCPADIVDCPVCDPDVITFTTTGGQTILLGTTLLDHEQYPVEEPAARRLQRWEIELTFDEIKNHLGSAGPLRSRTPEGACQELWAVLLAVHHTVRRLAHQAAVEHGPVVDTDRVSSLTCVRIIRRSVPSPARHHHPQTRPRHDRGREQRPASSARPAHRPHLPPSDQEAEPVAGAVDPRRPRQGRARAMGLQPDHEAQGRPSRGQALPAASPWPTKPLRSVQGGADTPSPHLLPHGCSAVPEGRACPDSRAPVPTRGQLLKGSNRKTSTVTDPFRPLMEYLPTPVKGTQPSARTSSLSWVSSSPTLAHTYSMGWWTARFQAWTIDWLGGLPSRSCCSQRRVTR